MRRVHFFLLVCMSGATALAAGCKPSYQLETAPVHGTVTLDGQPLPSGYVMVPASKGRMASGKIQPDGTFEMTTYDPGDGVQVGTHPVVVTPVPPDERTEGKRVPIPKRYQRAGSSGFTIDVKSGEEQELKLELSSKEG